MSNHRIGFVYVLSNKAMPGYVKVGKTTKLAEDRAKQLHSTAVPLPFDVEFRAATSHPDAVEREAHAILAPFRVATNREFFLTSPLNAMNAIRDALQGVASISAWDADDLYRVQHGDRIAFTMEAGDIIVILHYPDITARHAKPIDFWQAHSDGDLLEMMGTNDPGHVAGFSDGDLGGDSDPVPYLDRAHETPNGSINGRERLVPGQRLLWFRPMAEGECCKLAIFEMSDYCQVISRTWNSKIPPDGHPLLLNETTYEELPPCVVRGTWAATRMAFPRTWAPRAPDPTDGWAPVAISPQPPEHWLTQLNPPRSRQRGSPRTSPP